MKKAIIMVIVLVSSLILASCSDYSSEELKELLEGHKLGVNLDTKKTVVMSNEKEYYAAEQIYLRDEYENEPTIYEWDPNHPIYVRYDMTEIIIRKDGFEREWILLKQGTDYCITAFYKE